MAQRRMFSKEVIEADWFTDMPATTQMLYVHLSMFADDDGFVVNSKVAMMNAHATKDDLAILIAKNYVINVENGLYLIKHWRQNNYIQKDRYKKSDYADRLVGFEQKQDGSYTKKKACIQNGYESDTKRIPSIGKDSIGKYRLDKDSKELGNSKSNSISLSLSSDEENKEDLDSYDIEEVDDDAPF